jgi:hypothetical protein
MNNRTRVLNLGMAVGVIALSIVNLHTAHKIIERRGRIDDWMLWPGFLALFLGVALTIFWSWSIAKHMDMTRHEPIGAQELLEFMALLCFVALLLTLNVKTVNLAPPMNADRRIPLVPPR